MLWTTARDRKPVDVSAPASAFLSVESLGSAEALSAIGSFAAAASFGSPAFVACLLPSSIMAFLVCFLGSRPLLSPEGMNCRFFEQVPDFGVICRLLIRQAPIERRVHELNSI